MSLDTLNVSWFPVDTTRVNINGPYRSIVIAVFCTDSLGGSPERFVFSNDTVAPTYVRAGIFQNVAQDRYADIYAYGSEYLYTDVGQESPRLEVRVGEITTLLTMDLFSRPGTDSISTVYHTDLTLPTTGKMILTLKGEDAAGNNVVPVSDSLTVRRVVARAGGEIVSPDAQAWLSLSAGVLSRDLYLTMSAVAVGVPPAGAGRSVVSQVYRIGPDDCVLANPATLKISALAAEAGSDLGVYRLEDGQWIYVGGARDPLAGSVSTPVYRLGTYQVQAGPHGGSSSGDVPAVYALYPVFPNPSAGGAAIRYDLPVRSEVSLRVFNLLGQKVATLKSGVEDAGYKSVTWNGRDGSGSQVVGGVYFYELVAGSYRGIRKLVLVH